MTPADSYTLLLTLLEKALSISRDYGGYYDGRFDSAESFSEALQQSITRIRSANRLEIYHIYGWFLPDSDWEAIVGIEGRQLAQEVYSLIKQIMRQDEVRDPVIEKKHTLWGWIKAFISGSSDWGCLL